MDSFCAQLLKSVLLLPFMAGNYRRRQNGSRYYDCTISSRVVFLIVIAIIIVFTASQEIQASADIRLGIVMILLAALIACGTLGCFIVCYLAHKHGLQHVVVRQNGNKSKLQVIFLWIFALASGLHCSFLIGKEIECSINNTGGFYWNSILFYTIILPVGLFTETIFITYFSTYKLRNSAIVHYSMLMLLAANMSVLFYLLIGKDSRYSADFFEISHELNITSCLLNHRKMFDFIWVSNKILIPTSIEFCLLSTTVILEIWSPAKVHLLHNDIPYTEMSDTQDSESTHLLQDVAEIVPEHSENRCRRTLYQIITLTVSLAIGIGHIVCIMIITQFDVKQVQNVGEIYEFTWKIMLIIVNLVGFVCLEYYCSPVDSPKPFKTREYVYLFSACCMIMLHICEALAGSISSDDFYGHILYTSILSIFQDYLQVVFLLHANRCKKSCALSHVALLDSVLIYITMCNFISWFSDSFNISQYLGTHVLEQEQFSQGVLGSAYRVLIPVSVFFRFTSFLEYFATFKQYKS